MTNTEVPHLSYSTWNLWLTCGKKFHLRKYLKLPERPSMASTGGSAVHVATEAVDRMNQAAPGK